MCSDLRNLLLLRGNTDPMIEISHLASLGENLARIENFLFLANILIDFKFDSFDGHMPEVRPKPGITCGPQPLSMRVFVR